MTIKIDLGALRASGRRPRVHGNGFLQLDLDPGRRLHVWGHPAVPRQEVSTAIHNHRFNFESTILVGRVFNLVYTAEVVHGDAITHSAYKPVTRDGEDTELVPCSVPCGAGLKVYLNHVQVLNPGQTYMMMGSVFHETTSDRPSATVMTKLGSCPQVEVPWVLVPAGMTPDNEFHRDRVMSEVDMWSVLYDTLTNHY